MAKSDIKKFCVSGRLRLLTALDSASYLLELLKSDDHSKRKQQSLELVSNE